ncbi:hypothetical protein JNUCC0626_49955 (plasmid) [Lentzea sp. JNUCC 0626]|uniref:hypothetical protein n=1 Tax=Lentzea sp. JNUCC 0626 TaxID=3367513 RepID=UPI00374A8BDE
MSPHRQPFWKHTEAGLVLRLGRRADPVPEPIDEWLIGPGGLGLSADAAEDLLRLEGRLRALVAALVAKAEDAEQAVAQARAAAAAEDAARGWGARGRRRAAHIALKQAILDHDATVETLEDARTLVEVLREFVIQLDAPDGLLREAAEGWRRSPAVPTSVITFDDEESFLAADTRRATLNGWAGQTIAGVEEFGHAWRRDGDEDDPLAGDLDRAGPWSLGYVERTGEIYAIRRCDYLPRAVWLLGSGFEKRRAFELLVRLAPRMREPNSLILAAGTLHAARTLQPTRQCVALRRPSTAPVPAGLASRTQAPDIEEAG